MLNELLEALHNAKTTAEIERAFKMLEKVGMDRNTAVLVCKTMYSEQEGEKQ